MDKIQKPELKNHDSSILDLAFAMDCTGSMGSYIHNATQNIRKIVEEIVSAEKSDIKLALVEYRDHPPQDATFVTRPHDFTSSVQTMKGWLVSCSAAGGGDGPEAVADALHDILKLSWRPEATKICVLIADAPPHGLSPSGDGFPNGCPAGLDPMQVTRELAEKGITLYMVGCEPSITPYKDFFLALAYLTGGQYVPLTNAQLLSKVIIGGAQEEISLDQYMQQVDEEVVRDLEAGGEINEDMLAARVQEKLILKGAKAKVLTRNNQQLQDTPGGAKQLASYSSMGQVQQNFKMGSAGFSDCFGGAPPAMGGFGYSSAPGCMMPSTDLSMAHPMPGMPMAKPMTDHYAVAESDMTFQQVQRMVQKSKMRNSPAYQKKS